MKKNLIIVLLSATTLSGALHGYFQYQTTVAERKSAEMQRRIAQQCQMEAQQQRILAEQVMRQSRSILDSLNRQFAAIREKNRK